MIKRIITTTLAVLMVVLIAIAAPGKKDRQTARVHISKDSISLNVMDDSLAQGLVFNVTGDADSWTSKIVELDGTEYLLYGGNAFRVEKFKKLTPERIAHKVKDDMRDEIMAYHERSAWNDNIVALMSIIFIVPCVTIVILAVLLIGFLTNKNRSRNSLIAKAIDNNYPLPDSFYGM